MLISHNVSFDDGSWIFQSGTSNRPGQYSIVSCSSSANTLGRTPSGAPFGPFKNQRLSQHPSKVLYVSIKLLSDTQPLALYLTLYRVSHIN